MKFLIVSDLHGSSFYANKIVDIFNIKNCDEILFLGDILYHGPRNPFPKQYNPKEVCDILNTYKEHIVAVKGNCDSEVDQMVLDFNISSNDITLDIDGHKFFLSHGHHYNKENLPSLNKGDVLLNGHFHIPEHEVINGIHYINVGSISLPKHDSPHSYIIYENSVFYFYDEYNNLFKEVKI